MTKELVDANTKFELHVKHAGAFKDELREELQKAYTCINHLQTRATDRADLVRFRLRMRDK